MDQAVFAFIGLFHLKKGGAFMDKKKFYLNIYQALFVLVVSWLYTLLTYYIPFEMNRYSLCEIYSFQGVPFGLILGVVLNYFSKQK
ncbi:membrane protein [gut metagenome]|uniref:Membrane protein n=1 Tax=gut metagenome TaxID=749906 RepID=J9C005_9ZZZZ